MANIQATLNSLQPYLIGIRYLEGTPLIDVIFKDGWILLEDPLIKKMKGNDDLNYYMIFTEEQNLGLDDLIKYVESTIKLNQEREKKHELLKEKVNELKDLFKKNSLTKLKKLKFIFNEDIEDEVLLPDLNDFDTEEIEDSSNTIVEEPNTTISPLEQQLTQELTEEEKEILEEEARAERNRKLIQNRKQTPSKIELPPKPKKEMLVNVTDNGYSGECECDENEACEKCIDRKGF